MHVQSAPWSGGRSGLALAVFFVLTLSAQQAGAYVISDVDGTRTEGWDGPGLHAVTIDWYLGWSELPNNGRPTGFSLSEVEAQIMQAMATWSSVAAITWNYVGNAVANPMVDPFGSWPTESIVNIFWAADDHGDNPPDPFDGPWFPSANTGGILAHAYNPPDIETTIYDGNIHLDAAERWVTDVGAATVPFIDIQTVILHELGHVLGLDHSFDSNAVMRPGYFGPDRTLDVDDIRGIQSLYQCSGQTWFGQPCPSTGSEPGVPPVPPISLPEPGTVTLLALAIAFALGKSRVAR